MIERDELAIIGDVHGNASLLEVLLTKIPDSQQLIFTGDLVNRGPHSKKVMEIVSELVLQGRAQLVMGNHELYLLEYLNGGSFVDFALRGGVPTILSYVPEVHGDVRRALIEAFPNSHWSLLNGAASEFKQDGLLVKHWDPRAELALQNEVEAGDLLVVGHRVQQHVTVKSGVVYLDTGSGSPKGALSAFFWPSRTFLTIG